MKTIQEIYDEYNVDIKRLKRDYSLNPIKIVSRNINGGTMKELPFKDDAYYLYIELNMLREDLSIVFNRSESNLIKILREMGIKKDTKKVKENTARNLLKKEGIINVFQRDEVKEKSRNSNMKKYGAEYYSSTNECKQKVKETTFNHYGVNNVAQADVNKEKARLTSLRLYGVNNPTQRNYTDFQKELLYNRDKLYQYIKDNEILNIKDLSKRIGIRYRTLWSIINHNNWYYLFDYSLSLIELEVRDYINQYFETENNTKKYLDGKEIDIYIPSKRIGIEFNGNYWHCEQYKDKFYHQNKSKIAEENGIFLYHIFEYEWNTKKEQILNQINNLLGLNESKIYARKCVIKEVSNKEKAVFLNDNHLQGNDSSSVKLGLYNNDELVSLMTFCKPRFNKNYEYELSRFCSKAGCNVIGGASRLFKAFIKTYNPKSIISYSNVAHTRGLLYETLGFNLLQISEPNYVWCKSDSVLTRYQCQKHKLLEQGFEGKSEVDIMQKRCYNRIYDCGNKVWTWK